MNSSGSSWQSKLESLFNSVTPYGHSILPRVFMKMMKGMAPMLSQKNINILPVMYFSDTDSSGIFSGVTADAGHDHTKAQECGLQSHLPKLFLVCSVNGVATYGEEHDCGHIKTFTRHSDESPSGTSVADIPKPPLGSLTGSFSHVLEALPFGQILCGHPCFMGNWCLLSRTVMCSILFQFTSSWFR